MSAGTCTPGPWEACGQYVRGPMSEGGFLIAEVPANTGHCQQDTSLIAEAGTVKHETGLTPRQLAVQRAELLEALRAICDEQDERQGYASCEAYDRARAAIAKAEAQQ